MGQLVNKKQLYERAVSLGFIDSTLVQKQELMNEWVIQWLLPSFYTVCVGRPIQ